MRLPEEQLYERIKITGRTIGKLANLNPDNEEFGVTILLNQFAIMEVLQKLLGDKNEI